jgi:pimeloyl-ACP methyl ester carboxylesterase
VLQPTPFQPFRPDQLKSKACQEALYRANVANLQGQVDSERAQIQQGELQANSESLLLTQPGPDAKGTVVMYHGYTAGPWQYKEMAKQYFDAGYNVYAPLMPGHGRTEAGGMPTGAEIPRLHQGDQWKAFADRTFEQASSLGAPVFTVGLSGGADVALSVAERHPEVKGVAAVAPYLGGNLGHGPMLIFPAMRLLDKLSFGIVGHILEKIPFHHNHKVENDPTPHTQGTLGQAVAMQQVGARLKKIPCAVQVISTDGDKLSGSMLDKQLLKKCGENSGWYRFQKCQGVPHAMISRAENKVPGAVEKVEDIIFKFIDRGEITQRS